MPFLSLLVLSWCSVLPHSLHMLEEHTWIMFNVQKLLMVEVAQLQLCQCFPLLSSLSNSSVWFYCFQFLILGHMKVMSSFQTERLTAATFCNDKMLFETSFISSKSPLWYIIFWYTATFCIHKGELNENYKTMKISTVLCAAAGKVSCSHILCVTYRTMLKYDRALSAQT